MANVTAKIIHYGPWQVPVKVTNCLCPDGKRRTVKLTRDADTFFSIPARVTVHGKTVTGFVCTVDRTENPDYDGETVDYAFHPYQNGKNAYVFGVTLY